MHYSLQFVCLVFFRAKQFEQYSEFGFAERQAVSLVLNLTELPKEKFDNRVVFPLKSASRRD